MQKKSKLSVYISSLLGLSLGCLIQMVAGQSVLQKHYGSVPNNQTPVDLFTLENDTGMTVSITNYRGIITNLIVPGNTHKDYDVVLGYNNLDSYLKDDKTYFGAIVGRYANRIKDGQFTLKGDVYNTTKNERGNTLHSGGAIGFNQSVWEPKIIKNSNSVALQLHLVSPDGDQGFPGRLDTYVTYTLPKEKNELIITYRAIADKDTVINLTNHSYFNLAGEGSGSILTHKIKINANSYTPTDAKQIPLGTITSVNNTPFDLRHGGAIGDQIKVKDEQLKLANGYDDNFVLNKEKYTSSPSLAAIVFAPSSGIEMAVYTTEPGIQFYSGNYLNKNVVGKDKHVYDFRGGFALEAQHYPDAVHHTNFPTTVLKKGKIYKQTTIYAFTTATNLN